MKAIFKNSFIAFLLTCFVYAATAQMPVTADTTGHKMEIVFPPLHDLIDSAIKHNALVNFRKLEIGAKECNLTSQRNYWLRNFGMQGDTRYGNNDAFSTNANGVSTSVLNTSSRQFNYAIGVYFKIPVLDIVNRKTQIKQAKIELEQAKYMAISQQDELRQLVISQYKDLLLKQKLLEIRSLNLGSSTVNMEMIEKQFRNGVIPVIEYVRISDMTARIQSDYEIARSDFLLSKEIMEELIGFKLNR